MAHCPPERLVDLAPVFDQVRTWPQVREKGPGTFYVGSRPFLHFHVKDDRRWADVRGRGDWDRVDVDDDADPRSRSAFLAEVRRRYDEVT